MITEDYVSFETAKLLKERGYNGPSVFYDEEDAYRWNSENFIEVPNPNYDSSIPFDTETFREYLPHVTLAMAMKWLRENFNMDPVPYATSIGWYFEVFDLTQRDITGCALLYDAGIPSKEKMLETYEEACESAIKYCLENLI